VLLAALTDPHFFLYDCAILIIPAALLLGAPTVLEHARAGFAALYVLLTFAPALHSAAMRLPDAMRFIDTQWSVLVMIGILIPIWRQQGREPNSGSDDITYRTALRASEA
jgi:hypothetical protein